MQDAPLKTVTEPALDLNGYFRRIGFNGAADVSLETLRALHAAHVSAIPYENLDIFLGNPIEIEVEKLYQKLVLNRRGGYCFEMNGLFRAVLLQLGFQVTSLQARVWYQQNHLPRPMPFRNHLILMVTLPDGERWLADVGFGGAGMLEPLAFVPDEEQAQDGYRFRLATDPDFGYMLQGLHPRHGWNDMYSFDLTPSHYPTDYVQPNYYTSHSPDSWFTQTRICTRITPDSRTILQEGHLKKTHLHELIMETDIASDEECQTVLREEFGLDFSLAEIRTVFPQ